MKRKSHASPRNEQARALHSRAGNAGAPIRVDARPKVVRPKKGKASYRRIRHPQNLPPPEP